MYSNENSSTFSFQFPPALPPPPFLPITLGVAHKVSCMMWVLVLGTSCHGHHQHKGPNLIRTDTEATTEPVTCMHN